MKSSLICRLWHKKQESMLLALTKKEKRKEKENIKKKYSSHQLLDH